MVMVHNHVPALRLHGMNPYYSYRVITRQSRDVGVGDKECIVDMEKVGR